MKIQQMAFMLIAVTLFFALVGMFFLTVVFSEIKQSAELLEERDALLLVSKLSNSPEFSCGDAFGTSKTNCIDGDKVMALKKNEARYLGFWGVNKIEIKKSYPSGSRVECNSNNYPDCDSFKIESSSTETDSGVGVSNFVALCRKENFEGKIENKCEMARVVVYYGE